MLLLVSYKCCLPYVQDILVPGSYAQCSREYKKYIHASKTTNLWSQQHSSSWSARIELQHATQHMHTNIISFRLSAVYYSKYEQSHPHISSCCTISSVVIFYFCRYIHVSRVWFCWWKRIFWRICQEVKNIRYCQGDNRDTWNITSLLSFMCCASYQNPHLSCTCSCAPFHVLWLDQFHSTFYIVVSFHLTSLTTM